MNDDLGAVVRDATRVLRAEGRDDAADAIAAVAARPSPATPVVLVVGETGRGKTKLVDALLADAPAPAGLHGPSAVPVEWRHGEPGAVVVTAGGAERAVPLDEGRAAALVGGGVGDDVVARVMATTGHPLLRAMSFVDTPGVGGLSEGAVALTLQAVAAADAVVFVVDAATPLRTSEIEFLRRATSRVDTVLFVVTKTDLHRGWQTIVADDQAIVAQHAPRFARCPWVAVSSRLCLEGVGDPDDAQALRDESRIQELADLLRARVTARAGVLRDVNVARAVTVELAAVERMLAMREPDGDLEAAAERLRAERARLHELGLERSTWMQTLDMQFRKLPSERMQIISPRLIEMRRRFEAKLKDVKPAEEEAMPAALLAELTALAGELNEVTIARVDGIVRSILRDLDDPGMLEAQIRELGTTTLDDDLESIEMYHRGLTHLDRLSIFSTFATGRSMASFASGSGLGITASAVIAPPVGLAVGLALGGFFAFQSFRNRRRTIFATDFTSWMRDQIAYVQQTLNASFTRDTVELQASIREYLRGILRERELEINAAIAAADADRKQAADARAAETARVRQRLAQARDVRERAHRFIAAHDTLVSTEAS